MKNPKIKLAFYLTITSLVVCFTLVLLVNTNVLGEFIKSDIFYAFAILSFVSFLIMYVTFLQVSQKFTYIIADVPIIAISGMAGMLIGGTFGGILGGVFGLIAGVVTGISTIKGEKRV